MLSWLAWLLFCLAYCLLQGGRSVEVRPVGVTKGLAMQRLIGLMAETYGPENACFDFVLCIGKQATS